MILVIERLLLVGGVVLFGVLLYALGGPAVVANVRLVGWGILPIVLQEILAIMVNSAAWWAAFSPPRPAVPLRRLLAARVAGDAVNYLTPTATLGGEFARIRVLAGYARTTSVVASIAVAKLTQTLGLLGFLVVGLIVVVDYSTLPAAMRWGLAPSLVVLALGLVLLLVFQQRGLFTTLGRWIEGWPYSARLASIRPLLGQLDAEIARTHLQRGRVIALSSATFGIGWACGAVESYLILYFLGLPATWQAALTIEIIGVALSHLLFLVPLRAGTQEAGKVLAFTLLGLDPVQGLAAGILYRVRELFWALVGLTVFYFGRRPDEVSGDGLHRSVRSDPLPRPDRRNP